MGVGGALFKWLCLEVKTTLLVIKFLAWCQNRKILVRLGRAKLKYGIILFSPPEDHKLDLDLCSANFPTVLSNRRECVPTLEKHVFWKNPRI